MNFTILRFDSINSTNTEALNQARQGAHEGLCVVARQQTQGRGRLGRIWVSEKNAGLYFSIVLRPTIETKFLPLITLTAAVAVSDLLIELYDLKPDIKWANDVHVGEKKICGILAEMAETGKGLAIILGIGINLTSANFPPELEDTATSIAAETGKIPDSETVLQTLTKSFDYFYEMLKNVNGADQIRKEWEKRFRYFSGKRIKVTLVNEIFEGETYGLEENGALRVRLANGEIKVVQAGEVERVRKTAANE